MYKSNCVGEGHNSQCPTSSRRYKASYLYEKLKKCIQNFTNITELVDSKYKRLLQGCIEYICFGGEVHKFFKIRQAIVYMHLF